MYETKPKFDPKRGDIITYGNPMSTTLYTGLVMHANSELIVCARTNPEGVGPQDRNPQLKIRGVTEDLYVNPWGPTVGVKHFNVRGIVSHLDDKKYREIALAFLYAYLGLFYRVDGNKYILMNPSVKLDNPMSMMLSLMLGEDITDESKDETAEPTTTELIKTEPKSFVKPVIEKVIVDEIPEEKPEPEKPMSAIDKFNLRLSKTASLNPNVKKLKPKSTIINPLPFEPSPITTIAPPKTTLAVEADPNPTVTTTTTEKKPKPDEDGFRSFTEVVAKGHKHVVKKRNKSIAPSSSSPGTTFIDSCLYVDPKYLESLHVTEEVRKRVDDVFDFFSDFIVTIDNQSKLSVVSAYKYAFQGVEPKGWAIKKPRLSHLSKDQFIAIYLSDDIDTILENCFLGDSNGNTPSHYYMKYMNHCVRCLYLSYSSRSEMLKSLSTTDKFKSLMLESIEQKRTAIETANKIMEEFPATKNYISISTIRNFLLDTLNKSDDNEEVDREKIGAIVRRKINIMGHIFSKSKCIEDIHTFIIDHYDHLDKYMDGTRDVGFKNDIPMRILTYAVIDALVNNKNSYQFLQLPNNGIIVDFINRHTIDEILENDPRQYNPKIKNSANMKFWFMCKVLCHYIDSKNAREIKAIKAHAGDVDYLSSHLYPLVRQTYPTNLIKDGTKYIGNKSIISIFLMQKLDTDWDTLLAAIKKMPVFRTNKIINGKHFGPFDVR